jgi:hypothetical protein
LARERYVGGDGGLNGSFSQGSAASGQGPQALADASEWENAMTRVGLAAAALALGLMMAVGSSVTPGTSGIAMAQTAKQSAKQSGAERRAAARAKRAATRAKRTDCRRVASAQKMGYIKRQRFIRSCMRAA